MLCVGVSQERMVICSVCCMSLMYIMCPYRLDLCSCATRAPCVHVLIHIACDAFEMQLLRGAAYRWISVSSYMRRYLNPGSPAVPERCSFEVSCIMCRCYCVISGPST